MSRQDFQFFFREAGYVVGERAKGAIALARAESYADDRGWSFNWREDNDADWSWMSEREKERPHEVYACELRDADGRVLESLWSIFDPNVTYMRVIQAELALEAMCREQELDRAMRI